MKSVNTLLEKSNCLDLRFLLTSSNTLKSFTKSKLFVASTLLGSLIKSIIKFDTASIVVPIPTLTLFFTSVSEKFFNPDG